MMTLTVVLQALGVPTVAALAGDRRSLYGFGIGFKGQSALLLELLDFVVAGFAMFVVMAINAVTVYATLATTKALAVKLEAF